VKEYPDKVGNLQYSYGFRVSYTTLLVYMNTSVTESLRNTKGTVKYYLLWRRLHKRLVSVADNKSEGTMFKIPLEIF